MPCPVPCSEDYSTNIDTLVTWLWALPTGCFSFAFLLALLYLLPALLHSLHKRLPSHKTVAAAVHPQADEAQAGASTEDGRVPVPLDSGRKRMALTEVLVWSLAAALLFIAGAVLLVMGAAHLYVVAGWFGPNVGVSAPMNVTFFWWLFDLI